MKTHYSLVGTVVTLTLWRGEEGVKFGDEAAEVVSTHTFDANDVPAELTDGNVGVKSLAGYGLLKLLQDRTSQEKDPAGKAALMEQYFAEYFTQGQWKKPVERKEGKASTGSRRKIDAVLAQAVAQLQGISVAAATASLRDLDKDDVAAISANPRVVAVMDELRAEAKEEQADLTDLLG